jgi:protein-disulfide isomerase
MENKMNNASENKNVSLILSVITLLLVAINTFAWTPWFKKSVESIEAMKVGGAENYQLVKKIYSSDSFKTNQKASLEQAITQIEGAAANPTDAAEAEPKVEPTTEPAPADPAVAPAAKKLSMDAVKKIKDDALIKGNKNAKILIVEYSDLQCPFCKRHHDNGTIASLISKYGDKVSATMKQFPLGFHPYAQKAWEAAFCYADGDADKYYKFIDAVFAKTLSSDQIPFDAAKELGANVAKFKECVDGGKYAQRVKDQMSEGQSLFGINGTPGNVILNTENGEYVVVAWAYPASEFEKTLDLWTK